MNKYDKADMSASKDSCFEYDVKLIGKEFEILSEKKDLKGLKRLLNKAEDLYNSKRYIQGFLNKGLLMDLVSIKSIIIKEIKELEEKSNID